MPRASPVLLRPMTTYCAPCITELALVREAVTAVGGTASCMAHAVLLTYPVDVPGRRRQRLSQLRDLAESKRSTALQEEGARLELLLAEYVLAENMDMTGPGQQHPERMRRERPAKARRERGPRREGERGPRPEGERGPRPEGERGPRP